MRVVFAGTPEISLPSLEKIHASSSMELAGVISQPDAKKGRGSHKQRTYVPSAVSQYAIEHNLPLWRPQSLSDEEFIRDFDELNPDVVAVVSYGKIIPEHLLQKPQYGWINLHFSLLPLYRGASPVQSAILAGETTTGATTFFLEKGLDTGPVIGSMTCEISDNDTTGSLLEKLSISGADLLHNSLQALQQGIVRPQEQNHSQATHCTKITSEQARINWNSPHFHIVRTTRAMTPSPGAWTMLSGTRVKIAPVKKTLQSSSHKPGTIELVDKKAIVHTASECVQLTEIQPAGKKFIDAYQWLNSYKDTLYFQ